MNIYELSKKFKISLERLRLMEKKGVLIVDSIENAMTPKIRHNLLRGQPLTVEMLVALIENEKLFRELGNYEDACKRRIASLGHVEREIAPSRVVAEVRGAATGDKNSVTILIGWIKTILPATRVGHHYIAVRLALGMPVLFRDDIRLLPRAMMMCRAHPSFVGWWKVVEIKSRGESFYQRPSISYDL